MLAFYISTLDTEKERNRMTALYEEHKNALYKYALKFLKNKELAEDAVHNAFISILELKFLFKISVDTLLSKHERDCRKESLKTRVCSRQ